MDSQTPETETKHPTHPLAVLALVAVGIVFAGGIALGAFALFPQLRPGMIRYTVGMGDLFVFQRGSIAPPENPYEILSLHTLNWDADGFRIPAQPADHYAVLALGDSYTEGANVALPWPDVLAQISGRTVRNLGFRGYGPVEEALVMEMFGKDAGADYAILAHFAGNDFSDAVQSQNITSIDPAEERQKVIEEAHVEEGAWESDSEGPFKYPMQVKLRLNEIHDIVFFEPFFWWLNIDRDVFERSSNYQVIERSWLQAAEAAGDTCLIIAYFPSKEQIYIPFLVEEDQPRLVESGFVVTAKPGEPFYLDEDLPIGTYDEVVARLDNQRDALADLAERLDLPFVDLTPAFKAQAMLGDMLYYMYDSHWNQAGQDLAGRVIADFLAQNPCQPKA